MPITSTSLCPVPTVSRKTMSLPEASTSRSVCSVASASPPRCPRVPIERMYTSGSRKWSESGSGRPERALRERARGVDGDHADASPEAAGVADERAHERVADPGWARDADRRCPPRRAVDAADDLLPSGVPSSTSEIARARARRSPARTPATSRPASTRAVPRADLRRGSALGVRVPTAATPGRASCSAAASRRSPPSAHGSARARRHAERVIGGLAYPTHERARQRLPRRDCTGIRGARASDVDEQAGPPSTGTA